MTTTLFERFLVTAAREYADEDVAFVGFHWPMLAARIARRTHAPNLVAVYESGVVEDAATPTLSTSPSDLRAAVGSPYWGTCFDALCGWLARGRVTRTVLGAPIVDRRGNVNTTVVGDYDAPRVRLPGSGGGTELAALGRGLTLLSTSTSARGFPRRIVDYITSPGYLREPGERRAHGYPDGTGPKVLITPLGRFAVNDADGITADALHTGVTWAQARECFTWFPAEPPASLRVLPDPSEQELAAAHAVLDEARASHYLLPGEGRAA
ncbi:CoA-transferase [Amycolatopsis pithecellobii]|uniref:CoA-transferase n=1 Tax=Amycolatopsis pithecellobii TaxID=664692 RepID=UPI00140BF40D|nr:CoA-transferase [Amycolatopsis pithecellobii]